MMYLFLLIIAAGLYCVITPVGFIYSLFVSWYKKEAKIYLFNIAISIDQLGNVVTKWLLNHTLIKKDGYLFGKPDETISSVIGKNKQINKLSYIGKILDKVLNRLDNNHSQDAIEKDE